MKTFASAGDITPKKRELVPLAPGIYAYTAEGDPNSGVIITEEGITIIEAQATPKLAKALIGEIRKISDKPIKNVILTHYHAVRTLGASAYQADNIISSVATRKLIDERGLKDWESEFQRFPRLFEGHEDIPGLTFPNLCMEQTMEFRSNHMNFECIQIGKGHTEGDSIVWLPDQGVLFAGDLVEDKATPYCGDAYFKDWPETLKKLTGLEAEILIPGRGKAIIGKNEVRRVIEQTASFVRTVYELCAEALQKDMTMSIAFKSIMEKLQPQYGDWVIFEHCMPFNVVRAWEEVRGQERPLIWTAEKDVAMWKELYND